MALRKVKKNLIMLNFIANLLCLGGNEQFGAHSSLMAAM